jgi:hypothetical protein
MNEILTQEQLDKGLSTMLLFDHIILLDPKEYPIMRFHTGIDKEIIRHEADKYLSYTGE